MSAKQECLAMAAALNVRLVFGGGGKRLYEIEAIAPDGFRFVEGLQHTMLECQNRRRDGSIDYPVGEMWESMQGRLAYGLEACPADCDCHTDVSPAEMWEGRSDET